MTLEEILDIDRRFLTYEEEPGFERAKQLFAEAGAPTNKRAIFELLERILIKCKREGIIYPRIILRRRIEMRKGLWTPRRSQPSVEVGNPAADSQPPECSCRGGYLHDGKICPCPKGEPHREQFRKWGMKI